MLERLLVLVLSVALEGTNTGPAYNQGWVHGWGTALESQFINTQIIYASGVDADFLVSKCSILSVSACSQDYNGVQTEMMAYEMAQLLKGRSATIKVMMYWHTLPYQLSCYSVATIHEKYFVVVKR